MRVAVYLPLLASLIFAVAGPRLVARWLRPVSGAWALTVGAALCAAASVWSLVLLAGTLIDEISPAGRPRLGVVERPAPVSDLVALAAAGLLVTGAVRLARGLRRDRAIHRDLRRLCADSASDLVVLADPAAQAFAVPGHGGHIVVSSGMLGALTAPERRVLIAHERCHLSSGHHWHTGVVRAASTINPLLAPLVGASRYLCERWADEVAAGEVGDRRLAATSLAHAALAAAGVPCPPAALAYHGAGVGGRIAALQAPPARPRPAVALVLLVLIAIGLAADVHATGDFLRLLHTLPVGR
jgi:Zn-dependent protease with chaperone function